MSALPLVIGHRGAPGHLPELTLESIALAVEQGARAIEIDVVPSRDGELVLRHDAGLGSTTDVAAHPEFAARRHTEQVGGLRRRDWYVHDFTWAELGTLRAKERLPRVRRASARADGRYRIARLAEVLAFTRAAGVTLVIEVKHAAWFHDVGLPVAQLLAEELRRAGTAPHEIVIESFEERVLRDLASRGVDAPLVALVELRGRPDDEPDGPLYRERLRDLAAYADFSGISVGATLASSRLVERAAARGLAVWAWTLRPENVFLPPHFWLPGGPGTYGRYAAYWRAVARTGVSAVFADHPALAILALSGVHRDVAGAAVPGLGAAGEARGSRSE